MNYAFSCEIHQEVDLPDGDIDLERKKKRATEFSSRFSRNYLYPLGRDVSTISIHKTTFPLHRLSNLQIGDFEKLSLGKTRNSVGTQQKLIGAHHIISQALQVFRNHLPVTVVHLIAPKARELLAQASKLCELHRNSINAIETNAQTKRVALIEVNILYLHNMKVK